jgi:rhodanese-related sulfurtransferase
VSHAGDLTPVEAYRMLENDPAAVLVDVRTAAEWAYVGLPDLSSLDRRIACIEWTSFPDGTPNPRFLGQLAEAGVQPGTAVAFICRSGVRSAAAADLATAAGLGPAYNVADGFEGPPDQAGHRGGRAGWKASGLPWRQT